MTAARRVPPYFDYLIEGFRRGETGRYAHLGYWDPAEKGRDAPEDDLESAQRRLDRMLVGAAGLCSGQQVLDVGCGLGGTLESINSQFSRMRLAGVNVDPRQLEICRELVPLNGNRLQWGQADACALPFANAVFDRLLCIEAMFHFPSRRVFFSEAARVLRPGGALIGSDIRVAPAAKDLESPQLRIEATLQDAYGPWPDLWGEEGEPSTLADASGLQRSWVLDATAHTLPSHRFTAPAQTDIHRDSGHDPARRAALMLKWLHAEGLLRYSCFRFDKPGARELKDKAEKGVEGRWR
jgi:SAM-dependent methyltransferase